MSEFYFSRLIESDNFLGFLTAHRQVYVGVTMKSLQPPQTNYSRRSGGTRSKQHRHYQLSQKRKRQLIVMTKHTDDSASEDDGEIHFCFLDVAP